MELCPSLLLSLAASRTLLANARESAIGYGRGTPIGVHFTKNRPLVRRGERGWERWGGPLWTQSGGLCALSPTLLGVPGHSPAFPASCGASVHRAACRGAWHPQGPHRSTRPPRATTGRGPAPPPGDGSTAWEQGGHHVVARGGVGGRMGPCGCPAWDHPTTVGERAHSPPDCVHKGPPHYS